MIINHRAETASLIFQLSLEDEPNGITQKLVDNLQSREWRGQVDDGVLK